MYDYHGIDAIMNEFYRCKDFRYYQICISLDTFDCWCIPAGNSNSIEFIQYEDSAVISIWGDPTWTETRLIDSIDEAVAFNVEV